MKISRLFDREGLRYLVLASAFFGFFLLGLYGFFVAANHSFITAFYLTLQLLVLNGSGDVFANAAWQVQLAAVALPVFTIGTVIAAITKVIGLQWNMVRLQLRPRKHVFLGVGKVPAGIIDAFKGKSGFTAVAIDIDTERHRVQLIKDCENVMLIQRDIDDSYFLSALRLHKAKFIYCFTGDDQRNINIARKVVEIIQLKSKKDYPKLFVNVESKSMIEIVSREEAFARYKSEGRGQINWFSSNQQSALALIQKYPPRRLPLNAESRATTLHVAIVGQPPCISEFILNLVKQSATLRQEKLFISVFGSSRQQHEQFLRDNYPFTASDAKLPCGNALQNVQLKFFPIGSNGVAPSSIQDAFAAQDETTFNIFYVFGYSDYDALNAAMRVKQVMLALSDQQNLYEAKNLKQRPYVPRVVVRLPGDHYLNHPESSLHGVDCFHGVRDILLFENEDYPGETIERMAIYIHAAFSVVGGDFKNDSAAYNHYKLAVTDTVIKMQKAGHVESWSALSEFQKTSSIQSAEHVFIKLRELGYELVPRTQVGADSDVLHELCSKINDHAVKDALFEMEHRRFVLERVVDGWLLSPQWASAEPSSEERVKLERELKTLCLNKTLVDNTELSFEERHKDERIIFIIPVMLEDRVIAERLMLQRVATV